MTRTNYPDTPRELAEQSFKAADAEYILELVARFGWQAIEARHEDRGRGTPDDKLGRLWLVRAEAELAFLQADAAP